LEEHRDREIILTTRDLISEARGNRNLLLQIAFEDARSLDKYLLTLSAGALFLSITFIQQIVPGGVIKVGTGFWLVCAWVSFAISILSTLVSLLTVQYHIRNVLVLLDRRLSYIVEGQGSLEGQDSIDNISNFRDEGIAGSIVDILNWVSIIFFTTGAIMLSIFCIKNLTTQIGG